MYLTLRYQEGHTSYQERVHFLVFKKGGGHRTPVPPPPFCGPCQAWVNSTMPSYFLLYLVNCYAVISYKKSFLEQIISIILVNREPENHKILSIFRRWQKGKTSKQKCVHCGHNQKGSKNSKKFHFFYF